MDIQAHWQAFYDAGRAALDADGFTDVQMVHVTSKKGALVAPVTPPFVAYRDETERTTGTTGEGSLKVLRSGWMVSVRAVDLGEALDIASPILNAYVDADLVTTDGYETTALDLIGKQTLHEADSDLYAVHLRFDWERSL